MTQGELIDKCDIHIIAAGATALQIEEVSPTRLKILFPNKHVLNRTDRALASIIGNGTFTYNVIPEEKALEIKDFIRIDCETLGLGGGCEFLIGNGRWLVRKHLSP